MNFLLLIIFNVHLVESDLIRVVKTLDRSLPLGSLGGHVEVPGVGLADHEELSLCARLMTYQFSPVVHNYQGIIFLNPLRVLGSYATISSGSEVIEERYRLIHRESWQTGQTYGRSFSSSFPSWSPRTWNSVCLTLSSPQTLQRTFLNGELVAEDEDYSGLHRNTSGEVVLMNALEEGQDYGLVYPMFGAVTDLQVWSRALTRDSVRQWTSCQTKEEGDLICWSRAALQATGLQVEEMEKSQICREREKEFVMSER